MDRVLDGQDFLDIARELADSHKRYFSKVDLSKDLNEKMSILAKQSLADQTQLENSDTLSFAEYLDAYNKS